MQKQTRFNYRASATFIIFFVILVAFQNCGKFETISAPANLITASSTSPATPGGPIISPPPKPPGNPIDVPPTAPPDYKSDVFQRMGVKFGPKNGSPCELTPPTIPEFNLATDDAKVLKVCAEATCQFHTIQSAIDNASSGFTVAVKAGDYPECVLMNKDGVKLQGRGGRPHILANNCPAAPFGGAIVALNATGIRVENFEISESPYNNSQAGLSNGKDSIDYSLSNLYIHHVQTGVYSNYPNNMVMQNIYLDHVGHQPNPGDPNHVTSGISARGASVLIENSVGVLPNENSVIFGSSAETSVFNCLVAADLDTGTSGYQMVFGLGQNSTVTNSLMQKGPLSDQKPFLYWNRTELRALQPTDQLTYQNNIFIYDKPTRDRDILNLWIMAPLTIGGNTFIGAGSDGFVPFPNSKIFQTRTAAGISEDSKTLPYPGSMPVK